MSTPANLHQLYGLKGLINTSPLGLGAFLPTACANFFSWALRGFFASLGWDPPRFSLFSPFVCYLRFSPTPRGPQRYCYLLLGRLCGYGLFLLSQMQYSTSTAPLSLPMPRCGTQGSHLLRSKDGAHPLAHPPGVLPPSK